MFVWKMSFRAKCCQEMGLSTNILCPVSNTIKLLLVLFDAYQVSKCEQVQKSIARIFKGVKKLYFIYINVWI